MYHGRSSAVLFLICGSAALAARQQPAVSPSQPLTSGAAAIVVDAVVRDNKGRPVTGLGKEDFQLFEDGVLQDIGDVTVVMPGPTRNVRKAAAIGSAPLSKKGLSQTDAPVAPGPAFMAIVFDRLSPEARGLAYKGALACLDTLQAEDYVGVFLSDLTLTTIQPYTNDREKLRAAIKDVSRRATSVFDRAAVRKIEERSASGDADPSVPVVASAEFVGRPVDGRIIESLQVYTRNMWEIMARDQQGYATTDALLAITTALGTLPGRKSVVFFAEGLAIPDAVLPYFRSVVTTANRGNVSVYTIDGAGLRVHSKDAEIGREVRAMGAAGLAVNPDGSNQSGLGMLERNEDVLRKDPRTSLTLLASQTGGFLVENTNDLADAFRQIDADRRFHYLLTYAPKNSALNGEWRTIVLTVPNRRVTVRARSGYLAARAHLGVPLLAYQGPALAALDRTPAPNDLLVRATALVFPEGAQNHVAILASTDAAALRFDRDDKSHTYHADFTILARVLDSRGRVVRQASQPYRLSGPIQQTEQAQRGEILFFRQPTLAPGSYTLEVAAHDALAVRAGVHRTTFVVPETTSPSLQVSSLVVVQRAERITQGDRHEGNPLYVGDLLIYPNLGDPIRKIHAKVVTFFVVMDPAPGVAPQATLEVLRDGELISQAPISLPPPAPSGRIEQVAQVSIEHLSSGRYTLRFTVTQGEQREVRNATFQLVD